MGVINIVKTASQSLGPVVTGALYGRNLYWVAFLAAGALKATYDLGMLALFAGHKTREERAREERESEAATDAADEERPHQEQNGSAA